MSDIFGQSLKMRKLLEKAKLYAACDLPVLLTGESGVGKELLARLIHEVSFRNQEAFVSLNCAAVPHGLFESELFGYERGAFSGAVQGYRGLVKSANGGTLFLDEIGDLDLSLQAKLLRFLDSGEVRTLGKEKIEHTDVRLVAATNIDLVTAVQEGLFRLDLFERLRVLTLSVPPLRERLEDVLEIAENHLKKIKVHFDPSILNSLMQYDWPGNIRQLKNFLSRIAILNKHRLTALFLEDALEEEKEKHILTDIAFDFSKGSLEDIEKRVILERLRLKSGNRKTTAQDLGIAKSTLHEKLKKWNVRKKRGLLAASSSL